MSSPVQNPANPNMADSSDERVRQRATALNMLEQALAIYDEVHSLTVAGHVSMAVEFAKMELKSIQLERKSSAA